MTGKDVAKHVQTLQELLGKIINKANNWIFSTVSGLISSVHHQSVSTLQVAPCPSESSEEKMAEHGGTKWEIDGNRCRE